MNTTLKLIERVRKTTETRSDYAVAKALGITAQRMSRYMRGLDELHDDAAITRAAELIGDDPAALLAEFQADRAKSENARRAWRRLASLARQHAAAGLVAGIGMGVMVAPSPALANVVFHSFSPLFQTLERCILCEVLTPPRRRRPRIRGTLRTSVNYRARRAGQIPLFPTLPIAVRTAH